MTAQASGSEEQVLSSILWEEKFIEKATLLPGDFYSEKHQAVFAAMLKLRREGIPVDVDTLYGEIKKEGKEALTDGFNYIGYLAEMPISITYTTANFDRHVRQVKEASQRRKLWETNERLRQALENGKGQERISELGAQIEKLSRPAESSHNIISLAEHKPTEMMWLLDKAIPDKFPSTIYGEGGLGKSYIGLYFAMLASLGGQEFQGLPFPKEPFPTLYLDYELDADIFHSRAELIARGLDIESIPAALHYYAPEKSLYKLLPQLRGIIESEGIRFLIIDSLGAACVDAENVNDVVEVMNALRSLGIVSLLLDHQSKMQSQDSYNQKTPYGSVYKRNLSRSVFQLSCTARDGNRVSLMLRHDKSNFGRLTAPLKFDMVFEDDRVIFGESEALSPEEKEMMMIHTAMVEMKKEGLDLLQKDILIRLKGDMGRYRILALLDKGENKHWEVKSRQARGGGKVYEPKEVFKFSTPLYNENLENLNDSINDTFDDSIDLWDIEEEPS